MKTWYVFNIASVLLNWNHGQHMITIHPMKRLWSTVRIQSSSKLFLRFELTGLLFTNGFTNLQKISLVHILQVLDKKRQHVSCFEAQSNTPPQSLTARPWKMVGKEDDPFPIWGPVTFQGLCELAVKLLEGSENLVHLEGPEESRTVETTSHPEEISRPNASLSSLV